MNVDKNGNSDQNGNNDPSQQVYNSLSLSFNDKYSSASSSTASTPLLAPSSIVPNGSSSKSTLVADMGDAGTYSLCGLCTLLFNKHFPEECHRSFLEQSIKSLVSYFNLPEKVSKSMTAMLNGHGGDLNSFIKLIYKEMKKHSIKPDRLVEDLVVFAVKDGVYDARSRVIIVKIANFIEVPLELVEVYENYCVQMLSNKLSTENVEEQKQRNLNKKIKKYALITLATVGGGVIVGLTGGLAAPLIAAGAATITSGAAILGTVAGSAIIGSLFGVAGAGLTGYKMNKRVGNIEEFEFDTLTEGHELHITIAVTGWITENDSFTKPWASLANSLEQYSLRYESAYLLELGRAIDYFLSFAISMAAQEALKYTLLSGIIAAIAWPTALLTMSSVIDNPWGVCISRSAEVGKHLADILLTRQQGHRPVSLVGFSLGARVIFFCLEELAARKNSLGIIESVILLGAPVSAAPERWNKIMPVVSGRIVNGYCKEDWLLKFLYRTSTATLRIAGLQSINIDNKKLQNHDLSDVVKGHMDYYKKMDEILQKVGVRIEKQDKEDSNKEPTSESNVDIEMAEEASEEGTNL